MSNPLCNVNATAVYAEDVISYMKIGGAYIHARRNVIMNEVIRDHAEHADIKVDSEAVQVLSDLRRLQLGFHNAAEMQTYLQNLGIDLDIWEETLENELYREIMKAEFGNNVIIMDAWKLIRGIPAVRNHIAEAIVAKSKEKGHDISENHLQDASDVMRRLMGMHNAEDFRAILSNMRMSEDDWEMYIHSNISLDKMEFDEAKNIFENALKNALIQYPVIHNIVSDILFGQIIHAKAKKFNIAVTDNELQEYVDNLRRALNLHNTANFNFWLQAAALSMDEFIFICETELLKRKFAKEGKEIFEHSKIDKMLLASNAFNASLFDVKKITALCNKAKAMDISLSDDELHAESDALRRAFGLHQSDTFNAYLSDHGLTLDNWEWFCEKAGILHKLYSQETTTEKIEAHLKENEAFSQMVKDRVFADYANSLSFD